MLRKNFEEHRVVVCNAVQVEERAEQLARSTFEAGMQVFGKVKEPPRKEYILECTLEYIKDKRSIQHQMVAARKKMSRARLKMCFVAWHHSSADAGQVRSWLSNPPERVRSRAESLVQEMLSKQGRSGRKHDNAVSYDSLLLALHKLDGRSVLASRICPEHLWLEAAGPNDIDNLPYRYLEVDMNAFSFLASDYWHKKAIAGKLHEKVLKMEYTARDMIKQDFEKHTQRVSNEAKACDARHDRRGVAQCRKKLVGSGRMRIMNVKKKNGEFARSEHERCHRWLNHFAEVYEGKVCELREVLEAERVRAVQRAEREGDLPVPPSSLPSSTRKDTEKHVRPRLQKMGARKTTSDDLPNEVIKAGQQVMVGELALFVVECKEVGTVAAQDKGGRLQDLWKGKGDQYVCDNSRGLLIAASISKILPGTPLQEVVELYEAAQPEYQLGGMRNKSAPMGILSTRITQNLAALSLLCLATVLIDLVKGFDLASREVMVGVPDDGPSSVEDLQKYLRELNLPDETVMNVAAFVDMNGSALKKMGVSEDTCRLFSEMLTNAWAGYGKPEKPSMDRHTNGSVMVGRRGSRQGCPTGGMLFHVFNAEPLRATHSEIVARGAAVELSRPPKGTAVWSMVPVAADWVDEDLAQIAFVDDTTLFVLAWSAGELLEQLKKILYAVSLIFRLWGHLINWSKTVVVLSLSGPGSRRTMKSLKAGGGGEGRA